MEPAQDNVNCQLPWINAEKVEDSKDGVAFHKSWYTSTKHAFSHLNEVIDGDTKLGESDGCPVPTTGVKEEKPYLW